MYAIHNMPDIPCDRIRATAEPGTPQLNTKIKTSARIMLAIDAIISA